MDEACNFICMPILSIELLFYIEYCITLDDILTKLEYLFGRNTTYNKSHYLLLSICIVHMPLQIFHCLHHTKMSSNPKSVKFSHQWNSSILWNAQLVQLVWQPITEVIFISFHESEQSLLQLLIQSFKILISLMAFTKKIMNERIKLHYHTNFNNGSLVGS